MTPHGERPAPSPEEQARADFYALIARLLLAPPDAQLLAGLACAPLVPGTGSALHEAWEKLARAAGAMDAEAVQREFDALFVSIGTPPVNPYGSLYLAGFMMEKPLAQLRADLARLGLARVGGSGELEDHLGALCEAMRVMIGANTVFAPQPIAVQEAFFRRHIAPWYVKCMADLRAARQANFYRCLADLIEAFFEIEAQAFELETAPESGLDSHGVEQEDGSDERRL